MPVVLGNLIAFHDAVYETGIPKDCFIDTETKLGIAFVAMKRNIADLPALIDIGLRFGAKQFLMTNVLPYTKDMVDETLYNQALSNETSLYEYESAANGC